MEMSRSLVGRRLFIVYLGGNGKMEFETITIDRQDAVWLLTLDRQDRLNAMNQKMLSEIETACDAVSYTHLRAHETKANLVCARAYAMPVSYTHLTLPTKA